MRRILAIGGFLAAWATLLAVAAPARSETVSMAMDWVLNGKHSPFFVGIDKGFYREAGLDVKISRGHGSATTAKDVGAKAVDYGFSDSPSVIIVRARGAQVKLLAVIHDKAPHVLFSLAGTGIKTPADLKGKKIGATAGDAIRAFFPAFARANGLDPEKDYTWVTITAAAKAPSLLSGRVDAVTNFVTDAPPMIAKAAELGKKINTLRFTDWGVDLYSNGLATQEKRIQENPDQVRRVVAAVMKSWAWAVEHPGETIQLYQKYVPAISPSLARQQLDIAIDLLLSENAGRSGIGHIDRDKMKRTIDLIAKYMGDQLPSRPSLEEVYTNEFLPKLFPKRGK
ncbi:MAG: ABC transporter substrate-binding protein [Candidatus Tectomicrobia bacterium]|nr:ABC transporter substrate-binding protein [Candidatus Tectomicrobia bacterium]